MTTPTELLRKQLTEAPQRSPEAAAFLRKLVQPTDEKLSDDDVRMILELHNYHGLGYKRLAEKFEVSVSCIQKICNGSRRRQSRYPGVSG
jgi:hypothetical protein